jgi:diguanylate cyclase
MSPARTKSGTDHRPYLGDAIVEDLRAARLPFEPHQFEFWFALKAGHDAALNAAANAITARNGALTAADIEGLHQAHLSPWRMAQCPEGASARLTERAGDIAATIESAIGSATAQRATLAAEAKHLDDKSLSGKEVLGAIERLTRATAESQARFAALEARMDAANREIGALRSELAAVREECRLDPTTALPNRTAFNARLEQTLGEAAETRQPMSVMLCNLDYFAAFNENFGSHVGDEVLRSIGLLFRTQIRNGDTVARFGGDEYAAILPHMRANDAVACAERLREALTRKELVEHPNGAGRITVSIGVADAIKGDTPDFLLRRARHGLKVAKREGRNRVVEMTPDGPTWNAQRRA